MHGGWSNEYAYLGSPDEPLRMKHILDHGIANGEIQPMIVVCPTYNNTSPEDSGDYGLALRLTDNYHNELINDLIPAVEGKYSTYAEDITPEAIAASRDYGLSADFQWVLWQLGVLLNIALITSAILCRQAEALLQA